MIDIVILTCEKYLNPIAETEYVQNVLFEDALVKEGLEKEGLNVKRVAWSDPEFDWTCTKYALFRTTWDYFEQSEAFISWLQKTSTKTTFINSYNLAKWSLDKHYLQDLESKGVRIVPTLFLEKGDMRTLQEIINANNLEECVLKPAISAAARETYKIGTSNISNYEEIFKRLIQKETMLLQPFIKSVTARGEISLMIIGESFSHAVLKIAKPGDFRVQDDFGGTVHDYQPNKEEIALAIRAVKACPETPIYARVDIVEDAQGNPAVSELELVEPEMWFRKRTEAAIELGKKIKHVFF